MTSLWINQKNLQPLSLQDFRVKKHLLSKTNTCSIDIFTGFYDLANAGILSFILIKKIADFTCGFWDHMGIS